MKTFKQYITEHPEYMFYYNDYNDLTPNQKRRLYNHEQYHKWLDSLGFLEKGYKWFRPEDDISEFGNFYQSIKDKWHSGLNSWTLEPKDEVLEIGVDDAVGNPPIDWGDVVPRSEVDDYIK